MLPKRSAHITNLFVISWLIIFVLDTAIFTKATSTTNWLQNILWNSHGRLNDLFALVPFRVADHEYWRLLSYAFIHFGMIHVIGNVLLFTFVGNILENRISSVDFILPILLSDIIAGIGLMVINSDTAYMSGSSPGIYAAYGVLVSNLYLRKIKSSAYMTDSERNRVIFVLVAANFLGIDTFAAHVIGFLIGLFCGFIQVKFNRIYREVL